MLSSGGRNTQIGCKALWDDLKIKQPCLQIRTKKQTKLESPFSESEDLYGWFCHNKEQDSWLYPGKARSYLLICLQLLRRPYFLKGWADLPQTSQSGPSPSGPLHCLPLSDSWNPFKWCVFKAPQNLFSTEDTTSDSNWKTWGHQPQTLLRTHCKDLCTLSVSRPCPGFRKYFQPALKLSPHHSPSLSQQFSLPKPRELTASSTCLIGLFWQMNSLTHVGCSAQWYPTRHIPLQTRSEPSSHELHWQQPCHIRKSDKHSNHFLISVSASII